MDLLLVLMQLQYSSTLMSTIFCPRLALTLFFFFSFGFPLACWCSQGMCDISRFGYCLWLMPTFAVTGLQQAEQLADWVVWASPLLLHQHDPQRNLLPRL